MSSKEFNQLPPKFTPKDYPEAAYMRAKEEWDSRIGSAAQQAYNWRLFALAAIFICIILSLGLIYQSSKSTVTPYVIEVDSTTGMARAIGPAAQNSYSPKDAEIKYFISKFVEKTRTVPIDPVLYKRNWAEAYAFMSKNAAAKMNQIMQNDEQANLLGKKTVLTNIVVVVPATKDTYQVRWTEEEFDGEKKIVVPMTGLFTVVFVQPSTEKDLLVNPLGIYINDFSWSKEKK